MCSGLYGLQKIKKKDNTGNTIIADSKFKFNLHCKKNIARSHEQTYPYGAITGFEK